MCVCVCVCVCALLIYVTIMLQMAEFELKEPVDPGLPAAGKPVAATQGY